MITKKLKNCTYIFFPLTIAAVIFITFSVLTDRDSNKGDNLTVLNDTKEYVLNDGNVDVLSIPISVNYNVTDIRNGSRSPSIQFQSATYTKEKPLINPADLPIKKCIDSSNGFRANLRITDQSFRESQFTQEELVDNHKSFWQNRDADVFVDNVQIDSIPFVRIEKRATGCDNSYLVEYTGWPDYYLTKISFSFEGDYEKNTAKIEQQLNSISF